MWLLREGTHFWPQLSSSDSVSDDLNIYCRSSPEPDWIQIASCHLYEVCREREKGRERRWEGARKEGRRERRREEGRKGERRERGGRKRGGSESVYISTGAVYFDKQLNVHNSRWWKHTYTLTRKANRESQCETTASGGVTHLVSASLNFCLASLHTFSESLYVFLH